MPSRICIARRQRGTLEAVFTNPVPQNIRWSEMEGLVRALGGQVEVKSRSNRSPANLFCALIHRSIALSRELPSARESINRWAETQLANLLKNPATWLLCFRRRPMVD